MVCSGLEPGAAGWYAQTNPLLLKLCSLVLESIFFYQNNSTLSCSRYYTRKQIIYSL